MTKILDAQSVVGRCALLDPRQLAMGRELVVYVHFGPGTTSGQVVVESAHASAFGGTWALLATANWLAADRVHHLAITGVHESVRVRIAMTVAGGTVDAYFKGN